jgi:GMP synthase (glutamine-hydrolysing)
MKFRLLQAREPGDLVRHEERAAFADRLGVDVEAILPHDLLADPPEVEAVLDGVDAVLVGGSGAHSVFDDLPWMGGFIDLLGELTAIRAPMFASCFGFQGLVVALGGRVERDVSRAEVGTFEVELLAAAADDPIFSTLPARAPAQLGHKDHAVAWPSSMTLLARSERCPFQAARVGDAPIWASQFHPELTGPTNLARFRRYRDAYTLTFGDAGYRKIEAGFGPSVAMDGLLATWRRWLTSSQA